MIFWVSKTICLGIAFPSFAIAAWKKFMMNVWLMSYEKVNHSDGRSKCHVEQKGWNNGKMQAQEKIHLGGHPKTTLTRWGR